MLPSNSVPLSDFIVIGENDYHIIPSHTFTAMNNDIPLPIIKSYHYIFIIILLYIIMHHHIIILLYYYFILYYL